MNTLCKKGISQSKCSLFSSYLKYVSLTDNCGTAFGFLVILAIGFLSMMIDCLFGESTK